MSTETAVKIESAPVITELAFSKDVKLPVDLIASQLEKMRSDMGRYGKLAEEKGLTKEIRSLSGDLHHIVTPEMGSKLRQLGHITTREAEDIRHFHSAIKALEGIMSYTSRKAAEKAKLSKLKGK